MNEQTPPVSDENSAIKMSGSQNDGWLPRVRRVQSPNCDARPDGVVIDTVVIHGISLPPAEFGGGHVDELFTNQLDPARHPYFCEIHGLRVSSHFFIERNGEITQFVSTLDRAWHAGESFFCGRQRANDFSIGIEFEGTDDLPYENPQYDAAAWVMVELMRRHPAIGIQTLCGHADIAPGRKTDPGQAFDWLHLRLRIDSALNL